MGDKEIYKFPGNKVNVSWDSRLCIHIAECGQAKGDLFVGGRQPWCQPDLVDLNDVKEVVERCPSGALAYQVKAGSEPETANPENTISVIYNGPYYVRGDLDIEGATNVSHGELIRAGYNQKLEINDINRVKK